MRLRALKMRNSPAFKLHAKAPLRRIRSRLLSNVIFRTGLEDLEPRVLLTAASPFGSAVFTALPGQPTIIAGPGGLNGQPLLDLNGDGLGDLIVKYPGNSFTDVSAMLTHADGSLTEYRIARYAAPDVIDQVLTADLNGDGQMDVVVLHTDSIGETLIDVFMGQTNGTFTQPNTSINLGTLTTTPSMTIFDATGDGTLDLFLQDNITGANNKVAVYPGNGDGTFGAPATTTFPLFETTAMSFQTDLTGDGIPDMVISGSYFTGSAFAQSLAVYKGTATGAYNLTPTFSDGADNLTLLSLGHFSSANRMDIVAYGTPFEGLGDPATVFVFKNNGNGNFTQSFSSGTLTGGFYSQLVPGGPAEQPFLTPDLNKDGLNDMLLLEGSGLSSNVTIHVEKNNGSGGFTNVQNFTVGNFAANSSIVVADVDGDGFPDLVVSQQNGGMQATVFFNNGSGLFLTPGVLLAPSVVASQFRVADLDNNGKMDVIFTGFPQIGPNTADIFQYASGRTFSPDVTSAQPATLLLQADQQTPADAGLDYNGDNEPDFLGYENNGSQVGDAEGFTVLTSNGTGGFASLSPVLTFGSTVTVSETPVAGDINGDGQPDLVFTSAADGSADSAGIYVLLNGASEPASAAGGTAITAQDLGTLSSAITLNGFSRAQTPDGNPTVTLGFYQFTTTSAQDVRITASPSAGDITTALYSIANGVTTFVTESPEIGSTAPAVEEATLPAGTYVVEVEHGQGPDSPFRLDIEAVPTTPKITILQGFSTIGSGQDAPIDFGNVKVTTTDTQKFFTIRNDGGSTLTLSPATLPLHGFSFGEDPLPASLAPGASATFSVVMDVNGPGSFSGNVAIPSNDPDTPDFELPVSGVVTGVPQAPGIMITEGSVTLTSGQATAVSLGSVPRGAAQPFVTFTIKNTGNQLLTFGQVTFSPSGTFIPGALPSLAPGASENFTVSMFTIISDVYSANMDIPNNAAIDPFIIPITGTVLASAPVTAVTGKGLPILNNANTTGVANGTDFGSVIQDSAAVVETYTIANSGTAALTISNFAVQGGFTIVAAPASSVTVGTNTTFKISLPTDDAGVFPGSVSFTTNDPNNTDFTFAIAGTVIGILPTIGSLISNGPAAQGTTLVLTAEEVAAIAPATIKSVRFYSDTLGTGIFSATKDKLLGTGKLVAGTGNYSLSVAAALLPLGSDTFFAVATDSKNRASSAAVTTTTIENYAPPTIASLAANPNPVERGQKSTFTATGVLDATDSIKQVAFYLGNHGDVSVDTATDKLLGLGRFSAATHSYVLSATIPLATALGTYPVFAVATNKHGVSSAAVETDLNVSDVPPVIKTLKIAPTKVAADNAVNFTFTGVSDPDGSVTRVNVYWNPAGVTTSTVGAVLLGQAHLVSGTTWAFTGMLPKVNDAQNPFPTSGPIIFLAQATDNSTVPGNIVSVKATAVPQPAVGQLAISPIPIDHTAAVTFTASTVTANATTVQFWAAPGTVSILDTSIATLLGKGAKKSTGTWALALKNLAALAPGDYTIFVRAADINGHWSEVLFDAITID